MQVQGILLCSQSVSTLIIPVKVKH